MDALKTVPQLFFDAIARVVPGLTALLLYFGSSTEIGVTGEGS